MDHDKLFSVIDYGSANIRLGAFNYKRWDQNKFNFDN